MADHVTCLIHRVVGLSTTTCSALGILYENEDGSATLRQIHFDNGENPDWTKIRFIDEGPEVMIFEERVTQVATKGCIIEKKYLALVAVHLRRASAAPK